MWIQKRQRDDRHFTARQFQEKCQEHELRSIRAYMTFVGLNKAFGTVSRDGLWKIMAKFGCPPRFIAMVRQFHDGMQTRVQNDGAFSEPFKVKQGCGMAPTLVSQSCDNYDLTISTKKRLYTNQHLENRTMNQPSL